MSFASLIHDCRRGRLEMPRAGVVRQTVELMVLLCLCVLVGAYVFGGGLCRSDRLDGTHASGAASRDHVPELQFPVRGGD